jgi:serine/threonine protein kinase
MLRREYVLLRNLASPQVVAPLALVELDDGPAIALEYLPNGDLVSLLGMPTKHWLPAFRDLVFALTTLHDSGVAHGDVKARNVLFAADHTARLIDLTAARAVDDPVVSATAAYRLPAGTHVSARAGDCFALAALLFELTSGRLPYGPEGAVRVGEIRRGACPAEPAARRLQNAAMAMLEAGGSLPQGLSYFADVIESVSAAGA